MSPKDINILLYIAKKAEGIDYYTLFKVLYFAEQLHLSTYGDCILDDEFHALPYGPVPTAMYDDIKQLKNLSERGIQGALSNFFAIEEETKISVLVQPDMDMLSESVIECIDESIEKNAHLGFTALKRKSHGPAWEAFHGKGVIPRQEIAKEVGASAEMLNYIQFTLDNRQPILR